MSFRCYFTGDDEWGEEDYSKNSCEGCKPGKCDQSCKRKKKWGLTKKSRKVIKNCIDCDERDLCEVENADPNAGPGFTEECNVGISADDITNIIIPYCGGERINYIRKMKGIAK